MEGKSNIPVLSPFCEQSAFSLLWRTDNLDGDLQANILYLANLTCAILIFVIKKDFCERYEYIPWPNVINVACVGHTKMKNENELK